MANQELAEQTVSTTILETDIFYKVNSPYASGDDRYMTAASLRASLMRQFVSNATVTVANTAAETTVLGAGAGSATLDAGYMNTIGKIARFVMFGVQSNVGTPTLNLKAKFGSVVLAATGDVTLAADLTDAQVHMEVWVVTRATGATGNVFAHGFTRIEGVTYPMKTTAVSSALDLTSALVANVTADYSAADAGNTISQHILAILKEG